MKRILTLIAAPIIALGGIYLFFPAFIVPTIIIIVLVCGTTVLRYISAKEISPGLSPEEERAERAEKKLASHIKKENYRNEVVKEVKDGKHDPWEPDYGKMASWIFVGLVVIGVSAIMYKPLTEAIAKIPQPTQAPEAFIPTSEPVFCQRPVGENQDLWVDINSEARQPGDRCDGVIVEIPTPIPTIISTTQPLPHQMATQKPTSNGSIVWYKNDGNWGKVGFWSDLSPEGFKMYQEQGKIVGKGSCKTSLDLRGLHEQHMDLMLYIDSTVSVEPNVLFLDGFIYVDCPTGSTYAVINP